MSWYGMSITSLRTETVPIRVYDVINIRRINGLVFLEFILAEMRNVDSGFYVVQFAILHFA